MKCGLQNKTLCKHFDNEMQGCTSGSRCGYWVQDDSNQDQKTYDTQKFEQDLDAVLGEIRSLLLEKNRKYGDAVLNPKRIFSKAEVTEQIRVRLDDKISRLASGSQDEDEDVELDLTGYLLMLRIARGRMK